MQGWPTVPIACAECLPSLPGKGEPGPSRGPNLSWQCFSLSVSHDLGTSEGQPHWELSRFMITPGLCIDWPWPHLSQ